MDSDNRRQAVRIDCDLPIRLLGKDGDVVGRMVDLSRTGCRVRIPGKLLGVHHLSSLVEVTRQLHDALHDTFVGEMHYEMLGPLVSRTMTPCRIAKRDWEQTDVEVGCQFDAELSDEEVGMMGVPLPAVGAAEVDDHLVGLGPRHRNLEEEEEAKGPHLREPEPNEGHVAYVYPAPGKTSKPLVTRTLSLSRGMAILTVDKDQGWDLPDMAVADLIMALDTAYGSDILLRIVEDDGDLWAGPAELKEVDIRPGTADIKLGVAFGRELRTEELGRLGLPTPA